MNPPRSRTRLLPWSAAVALICSISLFAGAAAGDTLVYSNDFESPVGAEWSNPLMSTTPSGRGFLGEFATGSVILSLDDLPPHESVSLAFDLFIIRSWDGIWDYAAGPDIWSCDVVDGPALIYTTFSQTGGAQGYPTGPTEKDSLAYGGWGDSVYRISVAFPHSASELRLRFAGIGLQTVGDESWGLDDIAVSTSAASVAPPPARPGVPTQVLAVAGVGSATVSWTPSDESGSGIERYSVHTSPNPWPIPFPPAATVAAGTFAATVDSLPTGGATYAFRVVAVDTLGNVAISDWSNSILPQWELAPGVNQLSNSGFESGEMEPWLPHRGAERAIDTNTAYSGAASLYFKPHRVHAWYEDVDIQYRLPEFRALQEYTFSAFMKAEEPRRVNMRAYRAGGHRTSRGERHQWIGTEWREHYITFTPETDVVATVLGINAAESTTAFWIDDVRFYEGPYQPTGPEPVLAVVESYRQ
ncbi:MAG: carbohydrate binding domain-containing protein [Candidatus Poribacteria bacterium]